jgi:hypothetical protein
MNKSQPSLTINDPNLTNNYTIGNVPSNNQYTTGYGITGNTIPYSWAANGTSRSGKLDLDGKDADIIINGRSLKDFMDTMEKRLAILVPDPAKLEKYEALKKAYDHYILMEKLIGED